jgi:hypothetical protein
MYAVPEPGKDSPYLLFQLKFKKKMSTENILNEGASNQGAEPVIIIIDIEEFFLQEKSHPVYDPGTVIAYRIKIDESYHEVRHSHLTGEAILDIVDKQPAHFILKQKVKHDGESKLITITPEEKVDFTKLGIEKFLTEEKLYEFYIDQRPVFKTKHKLLSVRTILVDFAKVDPTKEILAEKRDGGFKEFENLNEELDLTHIRHFTLFDIEPTPVS